MIFAMIGLLQDAPGFDADAGRMLAQRSEAIAALFATGALSLSLLIALAMLYVEVLRAPGLALIFTSDEGRGVIGCGDTRRCNPVDSGVAAREFGARHRHAVTSHPWRIGPRLPAIERRPVELPASSRRNKRAL